MNGTIRKVAWLFACVALAMVMGRGPAAGVARAAAADAGGARPQVKPIRALMITGGCCHDYERQKKIISEGISARANVEWEIVHEGEGPNKGGTRHKVSAYLKPDWTKGYDIVVHNECFADVTDVPFIEGVVKGHTEAGVPAVVIHCTMHTFRSAKTDEWRKLLGVTSMSHEASFPEDVKNVKPDHPVMKAFPKEWQTPNGELYIVQKIWPNTTVLATAQGRRPRQENAVIWVNEYGKAKVFGTTLGHHNETIGHEVMLDVLARGLLWATGHLTDEGKPAPGYGPKGK